MVNDLIGGQFANNLRRMFGMPDVAPAESRGRSPQAEEPSETLCENDTVELPDADVPSGGVGR